MLPEVPSARVVPVTHVTRNAHVLHVASDNRADDLLPCIASA